MRITPNQPRLRAVALACWALGGWCIIYGGRLAVTRAEITLLLISVELLALLLLAIGVAFWMLSRDQRAGIVFDPKGLLLNLGHSSAFITWENIERVGVTAHRTSLFDLGSRRQIGIALCDVHKYVQTYEDRLPAAGGALARGMRLLDRALGPFQRRSDRPLITRMAHFRAKTGYDVLIPEALLGGKALAFAELIDIYRLRPAERRALEGTALIG